MKNTNFDFQKYKNFSLDYSSVNKIPKELLLNYNNLIKFNPEALVTIINNYYSEEEKINLLRKNDFIEIIPDYTLEMIINNMFFNSVFNMLQNKTVYNKIKNIDVNVRPKDYYLIPGYLDSTNLVNKSSHLMIFNLLSVLKPTEIKSYLSQLSILNKLTNHEIIDLASSNNINILNILIDKLASDYEIEEYINKMWANKLDYTLLKSNYVKEHILKLSKQQITEFNFNEIVYLYDYLNTHSVISIQETPHTIETFKSVLSCYYILGMKKALSFIDTGSKNTSLNEIKNLGKEIIDHELYQFKINNANMFDNITGKVINELNNISNYNDLTDLINESPYLRAIISLSIIYNYGDAVTYFNDYIECSKYPENNAKIKLYKFLNGLINNIYFNQKRHMQNNYNNEIFKHYTLKPDVLYNKKKKYCKSYFTNLKINVLINTVTSQNKEAYKVFYKNSSDLNNVSEQYNEYLSKYKMNNIDIMSDILKPLCNNSFTYESIFKKLNIKVPDQLSLIIEENKEQKLISKINHELKKLMKNLNNNEKSKILNYLCFKKDLIDNESIGTWQKIRNQIEYLNGNVFIADNFTLGYQNNILLENIDNYNKIKTIIINIDNIINYTNKFANKNIKTDEIIDHFRAEINKYLSQKTFNFNINSHNYETSKKVFCLTNITNAFTGFDLANVPQIDDNFKETFINNNYLKYAAMGYFKNYISNFGQTLSDYLKISKPKTANFFEAYDEINKKKEERSPLYKTLSSKTKQNLALDIDTSSKLYVQSQNKNYSTIPQIKGCINNVTYETTDFHDESLLTNYYPEIAKNYALHQYLTTSKNGCYINFKDTISNKNIGSIAIIRNGNVVYLNQLNISKKHLKIDELLIKISNDLIESTKNSKEPIEFVIFNTNYDYYLTNCIKVNNQIINNLDNPLVEKNDIKIFNDATCLLLASNKELNKNNIKKYDPESKYYRKRNSYKIISSLAPSNEIDEINKILYLSTKSSEPFIPLDINQYKEIIYGDDWIIAKNNKSDLEIINIGDDDRLHNEIDYFLSKDKKKTKTIRKIA